MVGKDVKFLPLLQAVPVGVTCHEPTVVPHATTVTQKSSSVPPNQDEGSSLSPRNLGCTCSFSPPSALYFLKYSFEQIRYSVVIQNPPTKEYKVPNPTVLSFALTSVYSEN